MCHLVTQGYYISMQYTHPLPYNTSRIVSKDTARRCSVIKECNLITDFIADITTFKEFFSVSLGFWPVSYCQLYEKRCRVW